ncbi:MAG: hypothetical protein NUV69_01635 [Candidatus Curtissbacteria bacterium]|nr:hypothetical protein [Candidatus Curtissbacteria bacterium]
MTRYKSRKPHSGQSWQKREIHRKWQNIVGLFITGILTLALTNGIVKSFSFGSELGRSNWDGDSSFAAVVNTTPHSILVFQKEPKRLVLIPVREDLFMATGNPKKPFSKIGDLLEENNGEKKTVVSSRISRSSVDNYFLLENRKKAGEEVLEDFSKSYGSFIAPFKIMSGTVSNIQDTNVTRIDQLRLWWQLKGLSANNLELVQFSNISEEIVTGTGSKILGVDDVSLHRLFSTYLENQAFFESDKKIVIEDGSESASGQLAADFVNSVGGRVESVLQASVPVLHTIIIADDKNSYEAEYLAKIFDCDITSLKNAPQGEIKVVVGEDFAQKYTL